MIHCTTFGANLHLGVKAIKDKSLDKTSYLWSMRAMAASMSYPKSILTILSTGPKKKEVITPLDSGAERTALKRLLDSGKVWKCEELYASYAWLQKNNGHPAATMFVIHHITSGAFKRAEEHKFDPGAVEQIVTELFKTSNEWIKKMIAANYKEREDNGND